MPITNKGTIKAAGIMYIEDNCVLLLKRPDGSWAFPGGKIEEGEKPLDAARRESTEEVGFAPPHDIMWEIDFSNNGQVHFTTYCARIGFEVILNTDEHSEYRWVALTDLPADIHQGCRKTIEKYSRTYGVAMDSSRQADVNGWIEIKDNPISKAGVFEYYGRQIDATLDADRKYKVLRSEKELSRPETINSFKLVPWIDEHVMLGPSDSGMVAPEVKGIEGVTGETVYFDTASGKLKSNIKVFSNNLDELIAGGKRELSLGYRCKYKISAGNWNGQQYDVEQYDIRGNHLALVKEGRMGPDVAVLDHMKFTFDARDAMTEEERKAKEAADKKALDASIKSAVDSAMNEVKDSIKALDARVKDALEDEDSDPNVSADKAAKDKAAKDKAAKDEDEEKEKKAEDKKAMDASIKTALDSALAPITEALTALKTSSTAGQEAGMKRTLQGQLANFGIAVDSADTLSLSELQSKAVEKLGIPRVPKGSEAVALDGFFANRPTDTSGNEVGFALDSAIGTDGKSVEAFFNA